MTVAFKSAVDDGVVDELRAIIGDDDRVLPNLSSRVNRTRVPAPFPVHRWAEFMPDVAILPRTAEEVSEVVKLANRLRVPVVPRAGGTGLSDGAVGGGGGRPGARTQMKQRQQNNPGGRPPTRGWPATTPRPPHGARSGCASGSICRWWWGLGSWPWGANSSFSPVARGWFF